MGSLFCSFKLNTVFGTHTRIIINNRKYWKHTNKKSVYKIKKKMFAMISQHGNDLSRMLSNISADPYFESKTCK